MSIICIAKDFICKSCGSIHLIPCSAVYCDSEENVIFNVKCLKTQEIHSYTREEFKFRFIDYGAYKAQIIESNSVEIEPKKQ